MRQEKGSSKWGQCQSPKERNLPGECVTVTLYGKKVRVGRRTEGASGDSHGVNLVIWTARATVTLFFLAFLLCFLFFVSWERFCDFSSARKGVTESLLESQNHFLYMFSLRNRSLRHRLRTCHDQFIWPWCQFPKKLQKKTRGYLQKKSCSGEGWRGYCSLLQIHRFFKIYPKDGVNTALSTLLFVAHVQVFGLHAQRHRSSLQILSFWRLQGGV